MHLHWLDWKGHATGFVPGDGTSEGVADGAFYYPYDLVFDSQGNLYINDAFRIQKWENCTGTSNSCTYYGWMGRGQSQWTTGQYPVDPTQPFWLISVLNHLNYYSFDTYFFSLDSYFAFSNNLAIDSHGYLYINPSANARITKFRVAPPKED